MSLPSVKTDRPCIRVVSHLCRVLLYHRVLPSYSTPPLLPCTSPPQGSTTVCVSVLTPYTTLFRCVPLYTCCYEVPVDRGDSGWGVPYQSAITWFYGDEKSCTGTSRHVSGSRGDSMVLGVCEVRSSLDSLCPDLEPLETREG